MERNIFKSKCNKSVSFKYPPVTRIINYVKETYEEETDVVETYEEVVAVQVVPAKPIRWYTKVQDFLKDIFTRTNPNDGYSSVNHGYSANHDEVNSYPNTVNLDVSDTVNLTGDEITRV